MWDSHLNSTLTLPRFLQLLEKFWMSRKIPVIVLGLYILIRLQKLSASIKNINVKNSVS